MPRREHDDRNGRAAADLAADVDAGHVGKPEVEHDEIRASVGGGIDPGRSVGSLIHPGCDVAERVADGKANLRFVVDYQNEVSVGHVGSR
jgi:hypothetical protein